MNKEKGHSWSYRVLSLGAPLALAVLECWHASGHRNHVYESLAPQIDRWLIVHILQLFLFPLCAASAYLLTSSLSTKVAALSRFGLITFAIFYTALDAIAGLAVGALIRNARQLPPDQQAVIAGAIQSLWADPIVGGSGFVLIGTIGTLGWVVGLVGAAAALRGAGRPWLITALLGMSGVLLLGGHAPPFGPLAFGCLFLAVAVMEFAPAKSIFSEGAT